MVLQTILEGLGLGALLLLVCAVGICKGAVGMVHLYSPAVLAAKMIAKTWLRTAKIKDVGAYFAVSDAKSELSPWDSRLQVSSRGYMMGYNDLKDPSVSGFFRFLAKIGDNGMKMQIVKIGFGDRQ